MAARLGSTDAGVPQRGSGRDPAPSGPGSRGSTSTSAPGPERAYVLTALTGPVALGDRVVVNTTAVELGLGTGGWHVVHWNLARESWQRARARPHHEAAVHEPPGRRRHAPRSTSTTLAEADLDRRHAGRRHPVAQPAPRGGRRLREPSPPPGIAYVMTDGAALPLALSDLVAALARPGLLDATITCGHAFGGDYEAVNVVSALAVARHVAHADAAVVAMGPGIVGTDTRRSASAASRSGRVLDAGIRARRRPDRRPARRLVADPRDRHRGLSHHIVTTLTVATRSRVRRPGPGRHHRDRGPGRRAAETGVADRHSVVEIATPDVVAAFGRHGLEVTSMGRPAAADPILFECAAAAGAASVLGIAPDVS